MYFRGGPRAAAASKMERFVIIVNGFQPLTIITKRSILDVAAVLDQPLYFKWLVGYNQGRYFIRLSLKGREKQVNLWI